MCIRDSANAVKELVICALLLASRKVVQGANWVKGLKGTPDIGPAAVSYTHLDVYKRQISLVNAQVTAADAALRDTRSINTSIKS